MVRQGEGSSIGAGMTQDLSKQMLQLERKIQNCRICMERPLVAPLPHEPRPVAWPSSTARLCIAGQAPGLRVHESGIPFDDRSGDRLRDWMGVDRAAFYDRSRLAIVPMGFCFPGYDAKGGDLPPRKECAPAWRREIFDLMPQIELILVIGQYAQAWHMRDSKKASLTETVKNWRASFENSEGLSVLPLPHPSWRNNGWLRKNPWFERDVLPVLRTRTAELMF